MRLKHVKNADQKIESSGYVIQDVSAYKGRFDKYFGNTNPIHIEIGMGKGNFIIENAKRYPHINFIGIEKYDSVIVRAIEKLEEKELPNLKLMRIDAEQIETIFEKEIDTIYLNFSDPWPKERHAKRRLTSFNYLKKYDSIFKSGKHIIIKTDNRHFFEYSVKTLTGYGYHIKELSLDLYKDIYEYEENIATEYEEKFHSKGYPIYRIEVEK